MNKSCSIYCTWLIYLVTCSQRGSAIQTVKCYELRNKQQIKVGNKISFDNDKVELFKAETNSDNSEIQQYRKLVLAGVDQLGIVKETRVTMTTVSYPNGWDLPIPTKYLVVLQKV